MITARDTTIPSTRIFYPIHWRSSYDGLDTDNSSVYRHSSVSSIVLVLKTDTDKCPWLTNIVISLDVGTKLLLLLFLFLVVISYSSTALILYFITVYPHTSVLFCGWHKVLSLPKMPNIILLSSSLIEAPTSKVPSKNSAAVLPSEKDSRLLIRARLLRSLPDSSGARPGRLLQWLPF